MSTAPKQHPKTIQKTIELPLSQISKSEDGLMRAIITAEIADSDGDIVVVEGMSWPRYDASNPLPVLSSHLRKLPDGKPSQIGYATKLYKSVQSIKGQSVPVVAMEWQWLDTELAREWQEVARKMKRLSFSIGATVLEAQPIEKNGSIEGFRFSSTELTEVSVVSVPANPAALSVSAEQSEDDGLTKEQIDLLVKGIGNLEEILKGYQKLDEKMMQLIASVDAIEARIDEIASQDQTVEAPTPNETTKGQADELASRVSDIINRIKSIKTTTTMESSTNGTSRDTTESH